MKKILVLLFAIILPVAAEARTEAAVEGGVLKPLPIALSGFDSGASASTINSVISNDLANSGLFSVISPAAFLENIGPSSKPNFPNWTQIGAQDLVTASVKDNGGEIEVQFRLYDVYSGQQLEGMAYTTSQKGLRRVGHQIADRIYSRLTGEKAYFDSRIVYVAESGPKNRRKKQLAIMDQDGANHQYITGGKTLVLTPRFSPGEQKIIYLSYQNGSPRVRTLEIETGRENVIGDFPGMTFAPHYNSSGSKLVLSVANNGSTDIYELDPSSGAKRKLVSSAGTINTSPFYSPDGSQIVFTSDRTGTESIYIMNADGSNLHRVTFGSGKYSTPVWSPRGDYIAFTKQSGGFHIGIIKPDGSDEKLLTDSYMDESPSWSPNGRVIVFSREERGGHTQLHSVDITGYNDRVIPTPGDASDPTWSPLLK